MHGKPAGKSNTTIFIASSIELSEDRRAFRELILEQNNAWHEQGAFLKVIGWEYFLDAMSPTRLQDEYNAAIRECDVFVMLYHTKVGKYTREEFETALAQFQKTGKPLIYVYYKPAPAGHTSSDEDAKSLSQFQARLNELGHFHTKYENTHELQLHFLQQLYRLADEGVIGFAPPAGAPDPGAAAPNLTHIHAGPGAAVAVGVGATALGAGAIQTGQGASGINNTGTLIQTDGGTYVAGDVTVHHGSFIGGADKSGNPKDGG
jgi:Domain of unknown function (DUF4062)